MLQVLSTMLTSLGNLCSSENACGFSGPVEPQPSTARLSVPKEPLVTCSNSAALSLIKLQLSI